jgi:hypothetical protein
MFKKVYNTGYNFSVDEAVIGFKGHFGLKQPANCMEDKGMEVSWQQKCGICLGKKEKVNENLVFGEQIVYVCLDYIGKYLILL